MFKVAKIKEKKVKKNANKKTKSPKKKNLFKSTIFSPIKIEEKLISISNSILFSTSNSSDSGKCQTNNEISDKTCIEIKNNTFLSKKIKFNIFKDEKINEIESKEKKLIKIKKKKKSKIFSKEDINEGRWGENEHLRFLDAIYNYGIQWKQVQKFVSTRSTRQVRSHAQKFFLKLKFFKDPELGFDFTVDSIKSLTEIINIVKEFEKNNKCKNILSFLNKKLSEPNLKINNINYDTINQNRELDVLINKNSFIINNQTINEDNDNNNDISVKKHITRNTKRKIFKTIINRRRNKTELNENNNILEIIKDNNIEEDKNENKENVENIYDDNYIKFNNNIYYKGDYNYDNSNQFECETNDKYFPSFSNIIKEAITNSLMNREYFC